MIARALNRVVDHLREADLDNRLLGVVDEQTVVRVQRMIAPMLRHSLTALGTIYWSDKAGGHKYTPLYERHLRYLRRRRINLLEIGIGGFESRTSGGASLRMWRDYFSRGRIHGVDIYEKTITEPRITIHQGDQSDATAMARLGAEYGPFDVIIDDGSHVNAHVRAAFEALFYEHLAPGGWYVIEDLATAYDPRYGGGPPGHPGTSAELVKALFDRVNLPPKSVGEVHVYEQIAFVKRRLAGARDRSRQR